MMGGGGAWSTRRSTTMTSRRSSPLTGGDERASRTKREQNFPAPASGVEATRLFLPLPGFPLAPSSRHAGVASPARFQIRALAKDVGDGGEKRGVSVPADKIARRRALRATPSGSTPAPRRSAFVFPARRETTTSAQSGGDASRNERRLPEPRRIGPEPPRSGRGKTFAVAGTEQVMPRASLALLMRAHQERRHEVGLFPRGACGARNGEGAPRSTSAPPPGLPCPRIRRCVRRCRR